MNLQISSKLVAQYVQRGHRLLTARNKVERCGIAHYTVNFHRKKHENNFKSSYFAKQLLLNNSSRSAAVPLYMDYQRRSISDKEVLINIPKEKLDAPPMEDTEPLVADFMMEPIQMHSITQLPEYFESLAKESPVLYLQDIVVQLHDELGLSWWGTMILSAVMTRTFVLLPLHINQMRIKAKLQSMDNHMDAYKNRIQDEFKVYKQQYGWPKEFFAEKYSKLVRQEEITLYKTQKIHPNKVYFLGMFQVGIWVFNSLAIRNLCHEWPLTERATEIYREMSAGGFGWITDLTIADPYYVLPYFWILTNIFVIQSYKMFMVEQESLKYNMMLLSANVLNILLIPMAITAPAALNIYWLTSSLYSLIQIYVLHSPFVQRLFRFPPLDKEKPYWFYYKLWKKNYRED